MQKTLLIVLYYFYGTNEYWHRHRATLAQELRQVVWTRLQASFILTGILSVYIILFFLVGGAFIHFDIDPDNAWDAVPVVY